MAPKGEFLLGYFGQADGGPSVRLRLAGDAFYSYLNIREIGEECIGRISDCGGDCGGDCAPGMCDLGRVGAPKGSLRQVGRECGGDCPDGIGIGECR